MGSYHELGSSKIDGVVSKLSSMQAQLDFMDQFLSLMWPGYAQLKNQRLSSTTQSTLSNPFTPPPSSSTLQAPSSQSPFFVVFPQKEPVKYNRVNKIKKKKPLETVVATTIKKSPKRRGRKRKYPIAESAVVPPLQANYTSPIRGATTNLLQCETSPLLSTTTAVEEVEVQSTFDISSVSTERPQLFGSPATTISITEDSNGALEQPVSSPRPRMSCLQILAEISSEMRGDEDEKPEEKTGGGNDDDDDVVKISHKDSYHGDVQQMYYVADTSDCYLYPVTYEFGLDGSNWQFQQGVMTTGQEELPTALNQHHLDHGLEYSNEVHNQQEGVEQPPPETNELGGGEDLVDVIKVPSSQLNVGGGTETPAGNQAPSSLNDIQLIPVPNGCCGNESIFQTPTRSSSSIRTMFPGATGSNYFEVESSSPTVIKSVNINNININ